MNPTALEPTAEKPRKKATDKGTIEKLRKPISFLMASILIFLLVFVEPREAGSLVKEILKLAGLFLVFAGALGRILCTVYIGGRKNRELCQSGIYGMCRNPLYFFSFLGFVGICLVSKNLTLTAGAAVLFLILYRAVIRSEEKKLSGIFPEEFPVYERNVPRFWPRSFAFKDNQTLQVSTKVFISSLSEVLWFLVALIAVEGIQILRAHGVIHHFFSWY
ncbi:MAG: isoprenylcysteine carboxylmethyltransferase family protein [Luteolibacter sp.]